MTRKALLSLTSLAVAVPMLVVGGTAARAEYVCKVKEYLPVHSCPKKSCKEIHKLEYKDVVTIDETDGKWYHVKADKYDWDGWVLAYYICKDDYEGKADYNEESDDYQKQDDGY